MDIISTLAKELNIKPSQAEGAVKLIDEGNTIPFIARYRKEVTGSLDDQVLRTLADRLEYLRNLEATREKIRETITEQGAMTDEISASLDAACTMTELDDIYRPFRPKRKTRASVAKAKGLEPLALMIYEQAKDACAPEQMAEAFITDEVEDTQQALAGASDIIAEMISDDASLRKTLREAFMKKAVLAAHGTQEDLGVYEMYADYSEPVSKIASHRVLAVNRGEREEYLKVTVEFDEQTALSYISDVHVKEGSACTELVRAAAEDAYGRLIYPSIEREIRNTLTDDASESAIRVFSLNLKQLLMQPPVKGRVTLGFDPGYRMGCKLAVVDGTGKVLETSVIYPVPPFSKVEQAKATVKKLCAKYGVEMFAIGNGTASHETEMFCADVIREIGGISYMVVSESGASVYSASKIGAEEFPDFDVNVRSAVSIARRLQDPLAELVKIDPKAIGVGQYQHDMPQSRLSEALDGVVEDCVNSVGVDLNTASAPLLSRVAGIGGTLAKNIVVYREENGIFTSRAQLKKVPKLGPKAFEQCAGFLRVSESNNPFDNTGVHPESYEAAKLLLSECGYTDEDIKSGGVEGINDKVDAIGAVALAEKLGVGVPTLRDIAKELSRPGRDPRDELPPPMLKQEIMSMEDLSEGMEMTGTVRNVIDFGVFVDIGVHQDGLVHISQLSDKFVKHPLDVVKVGDIVKVWVMSVDLQKKRISLTMKDPNAAPVKKDNKKSAKNR